MIIDIALTDHQLLALVNGETVQIKTDNDEINIRQTYTTSVSQLMVERENKIFTKSEIEHMRNHRLIGIDGISHLGV